MTSVIDTNVLIVANGKSGQVSSDCELGCIEMLEQTTNLAVVLDKSGVIMNEYQKHCSHQGSPGVGDMFFKYLYDHQYASNGSISLVEIHPIEDEARSFEELPSNNLDPSDRKFLATAIVSNARIVNATDSDWHEQQALMQELNITIYQLCPDSCSK